MRKLLLASVCAITALSSAAAYVQANDGDVQPPPPHHEDGEHKGPDKHGPKGDRFMKMFEKDDLDGDGVVTKEEFLKSAEEKFAKLDANADGKLTKDEVKALKDKMREKFKEKHKGKSGDVPPAE